MGKAISDGISGEAVVRSAEIHAKRYDPQAGPGFFNGFDRLRELGFGTYKWTLALEVTAEGRDPYVVEGEFRVPVKVGITLPTGILLPVSVSRADPQKIAIDWDAVRSSPERKQQIEKARVAQQREARAVHAPKQHAALEANTAQTIGWWIEAVSAGSMSRDEYAKAVGEYEQGGLLSPDQAAGAMARLDELP